MNKTKMAAGAASLNVGWGRIIFAHTFPDANSVARALLLERRGERDIAFYVTDPHLILNVAPQDLFLDPSNTYRLQLDQWPPAERNLVGFEITELKDRNDLIAVNRIYASQNTIPIDIDLVWEARDDDRFTYFIARSTSDQKILGVALAVDNAACFNDLFNSCSLWALAVDPQSQLPGVGVALVRHIADHFKARQRSVFDLSVMHDNAQAINLYESLGFERVAVLAIKRRNQINEKLFVPHHCLEGYNPYAALLISEALRRGIAVDPVNPSRGYFRLVLGNRRITCRESLTDLTSAIAMSRCDDKQLTRELLEGSQLSTPDQTTYKDSQQAESFLEQHQSVVVKPARGEQGNGVFVDINGVEELHAAIENAKTFDDVVLLEQFVTGLDLRLVVINYQLVAAAIRKPAEIVGTGQHCIADLLEKVSRRRSAATGGESKIPLDEETERCVTAAGYTMASVLPLGEILQVRRTANLHTGGTIHDVTEQLNPRLAEVAVMAAQTLEIPVVGLDLIVPDITGDRYVIIEANERPGLANHEPQPTAERFIDLLFPHTIRTSTNV